MLTKCSQKNPKEKACPESYRKGILLRLVSGLKGWKNILWKHKGTCLKKETSEALKEAGILVEVKVGIGFPGWN